MRKLLYVGIFVILFNIFIYAGNLRNYKIDPKIPVNFSVAYSGENQFPAILYDNLTAKNAIISGGTDSYEVEKYFNLEFKKQLTLRNVKVYDFYLITSIRDSFDSKNQAGTLNVSSVNFGIFYFYNVNLVPDAFAVISGSIEKFEFISDIENSRIAIIMKLYNRDTGYIYWESLFVGKVKDVIKYIIDNIAPQ